MKSPRAKRLEADIRTRRSEIERLRRNSIDEIRRQLELQEELFEMFREAVNEYKALLNEAADKGKGRCLFYEFLNVHSTIRKRREYCGSASVRRGAQRPPSEVGDYQKMYFILIG